MSGRKMPKFFVAYYKNYLSVRTATAHLFDESETRYVPSGSPQGGIFSPTFWNLAF